MKKILFGFLIAISCAGCLKGENNTTCNYDVCANKASAAEIQDMQAYLTSIGVTNAIQHCSGVFYVINDPGTGSQPNPCSVVTVSYVGRLDNGSIFDQSTPQRPNFTENLRNLIAGWTNTIPLLKKGGRITLYIPASLGYGNRAQPGIPANSKLIFEVTLVDFL
jgi:FKBP-type peptidyl-prolyl cis-trans isomerase FkpA